MLFLLLLTLWFKCRTNGIGSGGGKGGSDNDRTRLAAVFTEMINAIFNTTNDLCPFLFPVIHVFTTFPILFFPIKVQIIHFYLEKLSLRISLGMKDSFFLTFY
jgi:hypothetical protein